MNLKGGLSLLLMAVLILSSTIGEAARKHGRRAPDQNASGSMHKGKPYGAGLNEAQSLRALESEISRKLGSNVREGDYPEEARREGWSGTAWVEVLVGSNGKIKEASVQRSSGFAVLDEQAVRMIDRINLWWIPQRLRNREVKVAVPVGFYVRTRPAPPWISVDTMASILAERVYLAASNCRNTTEGETRLTASPPVNLVPPLPPAQDPILAAWTSASR